AAMQGAIERLPGSFLPDTDTSGHCWCRSDGAEIFLLINRLTEDISSTMIREELRQGRVTENMDRQVREYIALEGLYGR
ncbi:MAG: hypothetical protein D3903_14320, partial [Candidatus Electrothrix sp. GM3_4]|nr:hypothetical protein [Candidatus Electrothrix sp. GM3_4]